MYDAGHPKLVLCDSLEGWSGKGGRLERGPGGGGTHVNLWLIHVDV